jgi:hypothetical protein
MDTRSRPVAGQAGVLVLKMLSILAVFAAALVGLFAYLRVGGDGAGEVFLALAPYWLFPYLAVTSGYAGVLAARFARGRSPYPWAWGIAGGVLCLVSTIALPRVISPLLSYSGPRVFDGPAPIAFLAPVLSVLVMVSFISMGRRPTA